MKKRPSKRKIWGRFLLGRWISQYDIVRTGLGSRAGLIPTEFNNCSYRLRKALEKGDE